MESCVLLDADSGLSAEEISEKTGGVLTPRVVMDIIECWRRDSDEFDRRHANLAEVLKPDRLTGTMKDILTAARKLEAFDLASARPKHEIAKEARCPRPEVRNVRHAFEQLKQEGLLDAKAGANGGTWITEKGIEFLSR
jgi:hypothetical protein